MVDSIVGYRLSELLSRFGGERYGEDVEIRQVATVESAGSGDICFVAHRKYLLSLRSSAARRRGWTRGASPARDFEIAPAGERAPIPRTKAMNAL